MLSIRDNVRFCHVIFARRLIVFVAYGMVMASEACYEICKKACEGKNIDGSKEIPAKQWVSLYTHAARVQIIAMKSILAPLNEKWDFLIESSRELSRITKREIKKTFGELSPIQKKEILQESLELWNGILEQRLRDFKDEINGAITVPENAADILKKPEVLFFFRVMMPCWMFYGESITSLSNRAGKGEPEAMEKLLRLDKWALKIPRINRWFQEGVGKEIKLNKQYTEALNGAPCEKIKKKKLKVMFAALLLKISTELDKRIKKYQLDMREKGIKVNWPSAKLKAPEIRKLFDDAAKDSKGELIDTDLPDNDHSFYIAMTRDIPFWKGF